MANDLDGVKIVGGAPDVSGWAPTARISRIEFTPGDFLVTLDAVGNNWPEVTPPGWDGGIQFTLWVVINGISTGCIEFWKGRTGVGGPFSQAAKDWFYFASEFEGHQPQEGEKVGFFVTQGDARRKDVHSTAERSEVVWVLVPAGGTGVFEFTQAPPIEPPSGPPVVPDPIGDPFSPLMGKLEEILARVKAIPSPTPFPTPPVYEGTLFGYKITLTPKK